VKVVRAQFAAGASQGNSAGYRLTEIVFRVYNRIGFMNKLQARLSLPREQYPANR
jgi:hypothetical protein